MLTTAYVTLLSACTHDTPTDAPHAAGNRTATPVPVPAQPTVEAMLADDLVILTGEPFWTATMHGNRLRLEGIGDDRQLRITAQSMRNGLRTIHAADARGTVEAVVSARHCEDGMSAARYPLSGSLRIDGRGPFQGCARPVSMAPPAIPGEQAAHAPGS